MKLSMLQYGRMQLFEVQLECSDEEFQTINEDIRCTFVIDNNSILLNYKDDFFQVNLNNNSKDTDLEYAAKNQKLSLFWISKIKADKIIEIKGASFNNCTDYSNQSIDIAIGDFIENDIWEKYLNKSNRKADILGWLSDQLIIELGDGKKGVIISNGPNGEGVRKGFRVFGKRICLDVSPENKGIFSAKKILNLSKKNKKHRLSFIEIDISIKDQTTANTVREGLPEELDQLIKSGDSYIKLWKEYNDLEIEACREKAENIGYIRYESRQYDLSRDGYRFKIATITKVNDWIGKLEKERSPRLAIGESLPLFFNKINAEEKFSGYIGSIIGFDKGNREIIISINEKDGEGAPDPPKSGYLWYSLLGDEIRTKRRVKASEKILSGDLPMPQISLILENKEVPVSLFRALKPITSAVLKSFKYRPNLMQKTAIDVALNTPDIAIIQGPPGTGKTQIISALCTRLIEDAKAKGKEIQSTILLTAFQHDAVSNVASRTRVLGLPTVKIGIRDTEINPIDTWAEETSAQIIEKTSQISNSVIIATKKEVAKNYIQYQKMPDLPLEQLIKLLQKVKSLVKDYASPEIVQRYNQLINTNTTPSDTEDKGLIRKSIRRLRINETTYSDDGPRTIRLLIKRLESVSYDLTRLDKKLLNQLKETEKPVKNQFKKLKELQDRLLLEFQDSSLNTKYNIPRSQIEGLLTDTINELGNAHLSNEERLKNVLLEYADDLVNDPKRLKDSLKHYQTVLAATIQQSDGKSLYDALDESHVAFESIIVDEAARANPLDLFIALTRAKRRIILVGDHRQLPHMLERTIKRQLSEKYEKSKMLDYDEAMDRSLFERFFKHLETLEKKDGIKRTVTLNEQYRMHPVIGDFISKYFYEKFGDPIIKSGTSVQNRMHPFKKFKDKAVAWIDVPLSAGKEKQAGSFSRKAEAKVIMEYVKELTTENEKLNIGIITFYSGQVAALKEEGLQYGFTQKNVHDEIEIAPRFKVIKTEENKLEEYLRIGSVDSFQGKEFDVVFLSTTRANDYVMDVDNEKSIRRKYGFLTLDNRLNVAISRAKRLLVVVGDSGMVTCLGAEQAVYGLQKFYELTGTENGIRL